MQTDLDLGSFSPPQSAQIRAISRCRSQASVFDPNGLYNLISLGSGGHIIEWLNTREARGLHATNPASAMSDVVACIERHSFVQVLDSP